MREIVADRSVAVVLALALFVNLGTGMVLPILPLYARSFGVDYAEGGLIAGRLGLPAPLFFLAAIAVGLAGLMRVLLPKRPRTADSPTASDPTATAPAGLSTVALFRIPGFAAAVIALLANLWMFGAVFNTLVPLYARDVLRLSPVGIGILFPVALAADFLAYYPAGNWADTRGRRSVLIPAFACLALAALVLGWAGSVVLFGLLLS